LRIAAVILAASLAPSAFVAAVYESLRAAPGKASR